MNHNFDSGVRTEALDRQAAAHCLALLSTVANTTDVQLWAADTGVWNNVVLRAVTPTETYYFKQYQEFADIPNYSPPAIPPEQRAQVAQIAQRAAREFFVDGYPLVPAILAQDNAAFMMEAVPEATHLFAYLSSGRYPEVISTVLPAALARFHNAARSEYYTDTPLSDTRFRDYKLKLQYHNVAQMLDEEKRQILETFVELYQQQQACIVHGDLNSKNVLITPAGTVHVIDFEQAHLGTPAYDLAFILAELFIAELQHEQNPAFHNLSQAFTERYLETLSGYDSSQIAKEATLHLATQIIYRFKGPSHKVWTPYVGQKVREEALEKAAKLIIANPRPLPEAL